MSKEVLYIGYFDVLENKQENRRYILSAKNKMEYIARAMHKEGMEVNIVSVSETMSKKSCPGKTLQIAEGIKLTLFPSMGASGKLQRILGRFLMKVQLLWYLLRFANSGKPVIVYHSPAYMGMIRFAKLVKKFTLIQEVEEIYADVAHNRQMGNKERAFFSTADAYIVPTALLNKEINKQSKPIITIHGTYQVEQDRKCNIFSGDLQASYAPKIHCVYAGTFDPRKGGAVAAAAAEFLPSNYHIHIIGFGTPEDTQKMKGFINEVAKKSKATVTFDGLYSGEEYIRFIQSCDIGLSTQNPDAEFNATSFPSKVLSYLANGLRVVSVNIPAIKQSAIGDLLSYYDHQTPEEIAKAIMAIDMKKGYDSRARIEELDCAFRIEVGGLLRDCNNKENCK